MDMAVFRKMVLLSNKTALTRLKDLDVPLARSVNALQGELHGHGRLYIVLTDRYKQEIAWRAAILWEALHRSHVSVGSPMSQSLGPDLQAIFREQLDEVVTSLKPKFDKDMRGAPKSADRDWADRLGDARDHEVARYAAEIEHYVARLEVAQARGNDAAPQYNFHAPVGAVLTGAGARARVVQNITIQQREDLTRALMEIRRVLEEAPELVDSDRNEFVELASEAQDEVQKEKPNTRRLGLLLQSLAATVEGIANGPQAAEVLRVAATAAGFGW